MHTSSGAYCVRTRERAYLCLEVTGAHLYTLSVPTRDREREGEREREPQGPVTEAFRPGSPDQTPGCPEVQRVERRQSDRRNDDSGRSCAR